MAAGRVLFSHSKLDALAVKFSDAVRMRHPRALRVSAGIRFRDVSENILLGGGGRRIFKRAMLLKTQRRTALLWY